MDGVRAGSEKNAQETLSKDIAGHIRATLKGKLDLKG